MLQQRDDVLLLGLSTVFFFSVCSSPSSSLSVLLTDNVEGVRDTATLSATGVTDSRSSTDDLNLLALAFFMRMLFSFFQSSRAWNEKNWIISIPHKRPIFMSHHMSIILSSPSVSPFDRALAQPSRRRCARSLGSPP